jgi:hypothetical protein
VSQNSKITFLWQVLPRVALSYSFLAKVPPDSRAHPVLQSSVKTPSLCQLHVRRGRELDKYPDPVPAELKACQCRPETIQPIDGRNPVLHEIKRLQHRKVMKVVRYGTQKVERQIQYPNITTREGHTNATIRRCKGRTHFRLDNVLRASPTSLILLSYRSSSSRFTMGSKT